MIIRDFKFIPYKLKLKSPFKNASFVINDREGFIIRIVDENNFIGFGEVAPLPGFSLETAEKCDIALNKLHYSIIEKSAKKLDFDLIHELQSISSLPSLSFGIEQAVISLLIKRGELSSLLANSKPIEVNGLVGIEPKDVALKKVDDLLIKGFKTIKIKIGENNFEDDIKLIKTITDRIDDSIKIRIDVNGNWDYEKAEQAVTILDSTKIELIEQPVNNINELVMLSDFSPIPIAVDEAIKSSADARNIIEKSNIQIIILKPSILGGIIETITLIKSAERLGKKIIISSAFESVVGRSALMLLASLITGNHAHGLNTATYLAEDFASDDYPIINGNTFFNHNNYPPKFNGLKL